MRLLEYSGEAPSALGAPDMQKILALFAQQNEVLRLALTTIVLIPRGTCVSDVTPKASHEKNENSAEG